MSQQACLLPADKWCSLCDPVLGARGVRAEALELVLISVCVLLIGFGRGRSWCQGLDYHYTLQRGLLDIKLWLSSLLLVKTSYYGLISIVLQNRNSSKKLALDLDSFQKYKNPVFLS